MRITGKRARTILEATRKFFSEGVFTWHNSRSGTPRPLQYFLFNDSILLATPDKGFFQSIDKWNLKIFYPLVSVEIQEDPESPKFDIVTPTKKFTVEVEKDVDKDEWIKLFYWLRSSTGPRSEKISAEAQKRQYRKTETMDNLRPQKLKKSDSKNKVVNATLPKKKCRQN